MVRLTVVVVVLLATASMVTAGGGATPTQATKLHARVGPSFTISLSTEAGARVTKLDPGTYEIEVEPHSPQVLGSRDEGRAIATTSVTSAVSFAKTGTSASRRSSWTTSGHGLRRGSRGGTRPRGSSGRTRRPSCSPCRCRTGPSSTFARKPSQRTRSERPSRPMRARPRCRRGRARDRRPRPTAPSALGLTSRGGEKVEPRVGRDPGFTMKAYWLRGRDSNP